MSFLHTRTMRAWHHQRVVGQGARRAAAATKQGNAAHTALMSGTQRGQNIWRAAAGAETDQQIVRYAGITEDVTVHREAQAQAFALELSREKVKLLQNFVRDASHDLRSPLTSILLKLDLLPRVNAERQKVLIDELYNVAQHLNNLIEDLFTLSLIETDGSVSLINVDFNEVIRQASDDHRAIAQDKGLSLISELTAQELSLYGNRKQLFRLVSNLVANAIHYTDDGTITVRSFNQDQQAVLEVVDTGIGIPEDRLEAIFERFFRTEQARDFRQDGTGLGLAISKATVEQHGGVITVQSKVGQGSTFRVTLPLVKRNPRSVSTE